MKRLTGFLVAVANVLALLVVDQRISYREKDAALEIFVYMGIATLSAIAVSLAIPWVRTNWRATIALAVVGALVWGGVYVHDEREAKRRHEQYVKLQAATPAPRRLTDADFKPSEVNVFGDRITDEFGGELVPSRPRQSAEEFLSAPKSPKKRDIFDDLIPTK